VWVCVCVSQSKEGLVLGWSNGETFRVHVIGMELSLSCLPYDAFRSHGQHSGALKLDMVTQVDAVHFPG
jgi:hypothetical protein